MLKGFLIMLGVVGIHNLNDAQEKLKSAYLLECFLSRIPYVSDVWTKDEWKHPDRTIQEGGDCDDYAIFVYEVLSKQGYEVKLYDVEQEGYLHAICYYKKGREEGYFSNEYRVKIRGNLEEVLTEDGWINIEELNREGINYGQIYTRANRQGTRPDRN